MAKLPRISNAEWEVMNVLWERSPQSANDVVAALADRTDWNPRTVKTLLNRLAKKGVLATDVQGKAYLYTPKVTRQSCVRQVSRSLLDRVFDGNAAAMLVHLVQEASLSPREVEELRQILDEKGKRP